MPLVVLGTNHKTAKLELRERWSYQLDEIGTTLKSLSNKLNTDEIALLSTCNRTEVYCDIKDPNELINWFNREIQPIANLDISQHGYFYQEQEAVTHIMRVASGLDSLVIGEPQILGQFKQAYRIAKKANTIGKKFDKLFNKTFSVAKTVRASTEIGLHPMSVASVGANLILQESYCNNIDNLNILLVGSGDTIKTVGRALIKKNVTTINLVNRNAIHAHDLADDLIKYAKENVGEELSSKLDINIYNFEILKNPSELSKFNIILTATSSPVYLLSKDIIKETVEINKNNKLLLLDLAVPRDIEPIDPIIDNLEQVILYTVDDLEKILQNNTMQRVEASIEAEKIIEQYASDFCSWENSLLFMSSLCKYRYQAELMCQDVINKAQKKLDAGDDPKEVLTSSLQLLRNKLLHHPTTTLKSLAKNKKRQQVEILKDILDI